MTGYGYFLHASGRYFGDPAFEREGRERWAHSLKRTEEEGLEAYASRAPDGSDADPCEGVSRMPDGAWRYITSYVDPDDGRTKYRCRDEV